MAKIIIPQGDSGYHLFWCPGCDAPHAFSVPPWEIKGNREAPTVTPFLMSTRSDLDRLSVSPSLKTTGASSDCCHLYIVNGDLQFLPDSTHALAGKTVPIPEFPEAMLPSDQP